MVLLFFLSVLFIAFDLVLDRDPIGWRTDVQKVASFSVFGHAASVLNSVRKMQTPISALWEQLDALTQLQPTELVGGEAETEAATAVEPAAAVAAAELTEADDGSMLVSSTTATTDSVVDGTATTADADFGADGELIREGVRSEELLAENAKVLKRLVEARKQRMASATPWQPSEAECKDAAAARTNLVKLVASEEFGRPGHFMCTKTARSLMGAKEFTPPPLQENGQDGDATSNAKKKARTT
jgi:hypothetical protein